MKKRFPPIPRWLKWTAIPILILIGLFFGLYGSIYLGMWGKVPSKNELSDLSQIEASKLYDKNDTLIGKYFITDREVIEYDDIPEYAKHALIATEDARFYEHNGIDERSLLRVFVKSILMGNRSSGGGSTITLQLAKNLYGRKDYKVMSLVINKLRESIVARRLEDLYPKKKILTLYFNTVSFSGNTYGLESAAQKFFNSPAKKLNLSQAATLIGTLKANHSYNPRLFPEQSQTRRDVVLQQMVKHHYLSEENAHQAMQDSLSISEEDFDSNRYFAAYFKEQVKHQLDTILTKEKYRKSDGTPYNFKKDGLKIYTTLDAKLQEYAEKAMRERMGALQDQFEKSFGPNAPWETNQSIISSVIKNSSAYKSLQKKGVSQDEIKDSLDQPKATELFEWDKNKVKRVSTIDSLKHYLKFLNTGLVSLDPNSGAVRAYIGGIDHRYFQYDHVMQGRRQVGSTFKPLVYTFALENGVNPCDYFSVREVTYKDQDNWTPKNVNSDIDPEMNYSMTAALSQSINTIAVKLLRQAGIDHVVKGVKKMGIDKDIEHKPSIALGTSTLRPIDLAKAYSTFLNNSKPVAPFFITRIENKNGETIAEFEPKDNRKQAFSETTRQTMLEMLKNVVNTGTAQRLRQTYGFQNALAGKTGTTQDNTDGWFVGLLPHLVTVTWVGNDDARIKFNSTALGQGANTALPIFAKMLQQMNQDPYFDRITQSQFKTASQEVQSGMDCPPSKRNGFLKRLFQSDKKTKDFKKEKKEKGFFQRLFGG